MISVRYELHPPQDTPTPNLPSSKTHEIPIIVAVEDPQTVKGYYEGLRQAITQTRSTLGEELTAWRDAVGNTEQPKEGKKSKNDGEVDEDDVEEECVPQLAQTLTWAFTIAAGVDRLL
ncbi:hypothetical protein B0H21DRAFT_813775 [Amylocystis lapponica]|nr:hypothetical protein B0H21DRAFT_813775 [Amylocystis lapponica]